jgi:anthranilate synthase/aminodeoxychorismate synthase-like glutamine amidotransferase
MPVLLIDNYDSFTYNLAQYLWELGADLVVKRNDEIDLDEVRALDPERIIISPGPGNPTEGGVSLDVIREFATEKPILGVCLGHQCIASAFGGEVLRAPRLMHGKTSLVYHDGQGLFEGIPNPVTAMRYHSLIVEKPLPEGLEAVAYTGEGEVMAVRHKEYPLYGVQFHPESVLTEHGREMLQNFLERCG